MLVKMAVPATELVTATTTPHGCYPPCFFTMSIRRRICHAVAKLPLSSATPEEVANELDKIRSAVQLFGRT
jgi:hypothetical protein